jgi:N-terminal domain of unknown function (DUF4140)
MEANKVEMEVASLSVKHVTVYQDRAEVKRTLKASLKQGPNEVVVTKLSASIEQDSIRVEGRGAATISEVKYHEEFVRKEEEVNAKQKELRKKLDSLTEQRAVVEGEQARLLKQKSVLDGVAGRVAAGGAGGADKVSTRAGKSSALECVLIVGVGWCGVWCRATACRWSTSL